MTNQDIAPPTIIEEPKIRHVIREDFRGSSLKERAYFIGTCIVIGPHELGMETAIAATGVAAFNVNPLLTGVAMGATSIAVESGMSQGLAHSMEAFKSSTLAIKNKYFSDDEPLPGEKVDAINESVEEAGKAKLAEKADTGTIAISLGSPGIMMREFGRDPERTLEQNRNTGLKTGAGLAAFNFALGTTIGLIAVISSKAGAMEVNDTIKAIGESRITYAAIFALVAGPRIYKHFNKKIKRKRAIAAMKHNNELSAVPNIAIEEENV